MPSVARGKTTPPRRPHRFRWALWLVAFLGFGLVASAAGLVYFAVATITGTEFDSVSWTVREFRFVRDPFSETQLTSIKHHGARGFTLDPVIASRIGGGPARPALPRWDLVRIYRGLSPGEGEALILLQYLKAEDSQGTNYWAQWTTDHPQAAPILWGAVRDAVHLARYDRLPEIFDCVRVNDQPAALKAALAKVMLRLALDDARAHIQAGDKDGARPAALVGLSYGQSDELRALAGNVERAD